MRFNNARGKYAADDPSVSHRFRLWVRIIYVDEIRTCTAILLYTLRYSPDDQIFNFHAARGRFSPPLPSLSRKFSSFFFFWCFDNSNFLFGGVRWVFIDKNFNHKVWYFARFLIASSKARGKWRYYSFGFWTTKRDENLYVPEFKKRCMA